MILHPNAQGDLRPGRVSRRGLLLRAGAASVAASLRHAQAAEPAVDHTIRIGPVSLDPLPSGSAGHFSSMLLSRKLVSYCPRPKHRSGLRSPVTREV